MAARSLEQGNGRGGPAKQLAVAMMLVTALAAGIGAFAGLRLPAYAAQSQPGQAAKVSPKSGSAIADLPPMVTNLRRPKDIWVRLEASMIFDRSKVPDSAVLAGRVAADLLAYLHTLTLTDIQGPTGLLGVRADLDERASIRSQGAVKEIVIRTLVVQ